MLNHKMMKTCINNCIVRQINEIGKVLCIFKLLINWWYPAHSQNFKAWNPNVEIIFWGKVVLSDMCFLFFFIILRGSLYVQVHNNDHDYFIQMFCILRNVQKSNTGRTSGIVSGAFIRKSHTLVQSSILLLVIVNIKSKFFVSVIS